MNKRTLQSLILGIAIGVAVGLGVYTFVYAKGASYLTNDPASCANCHVMNEQYDGWMKSSHRAVATCNDCHTPANFVGKYVTKASNGFWHSFYFTTGTFHEPIRIKRAQPGDHRAGLPEVPRRHHPCDRDQLLWPASGAARRVLSCVRCHRSVGHLH